jgi:integrase
LPLRATLTYLPIISHLTLTDKREFAGSFAFCYNHLELNIARCAFLNLWEPEIWRALFVLYRGETARIFILEAHMAKNRGHNEGTIYQRADGRWCAQVSLNGHRLTHYGKTQRECREWLKETIAQVDSGLTIEGAKVTLGEYLEKWLETVSPRLRPKSIKLYANAIRRHITPHIGAIKLKDLRPDHIQSLYSSRQAAGAGAQTIHIVHAVLHRSLAQALRWGLVTRNPADAVDKPKLVREEMRVLTPEQVRVLLEAAQGDRLGALYYLAVTTGLREGELLGLRWSDLDWKTGKLQIQRQVQHLTGRGKVFTEPKSASGRRSIILGPIALERLRDHLEDQEARRILAGARWQEYGLIFTSTIGTPIESRVLVDLFKKLLDKAGLPKIRFHDLRHTAATLMLQQGVHPKVVQERLGHSNIGLTLNTYSHVLPGMQQDAAEKLDALFAPFTAKLLQSPKTESTQ